jgi:O-antigen ligase
LSPFFVLDFLMLNAAVLLLLSCCWIIPEHLPPWYAFHTEVPAFAASAVGMVALLGRATSPVKIPPALGWHFLLVVLVAAQWLTGRIAFGGDAWVAIAYIGVFSVAWIWVQHWAQKDGSQEVLLAISILLIFVGLATSFQLLAQWLHVDHLFGGWVLDPLPNGRPRANLGQSNQAATTLVMAMVATGYLFSRNRIKLNVAWVLVLVLVWAATTTQSRTALLSIAVVGLGFCVFVRGSSVSWHSRTSVLLWVLWSVGAMWIFASIDLLDQSAALSSEQVASVGTRPLLWCQFIDAVLDQPWLGWGWLQVATAQQTGSLVFPGTEQANYTHNVLLDGLVMLGIPATGLLIVMVLWWLFRKGSDLCRSLDALWCLALATPILVHSMLEFPHAYSYYLVLLGILIGVMDACSRTVDARLFHLHKLAVVGVAGVWLTLLATLGYEYTQAEEDFRVNRFENRRIGPQIADYKPPKLLFLTQLDGLARAMRLRAVRNMSIEDVELLQRVAKRYTWGPLEFRAAMALALNGRPGDATVRLQVIKSLFSQDIYEEARDNFQLLGDDKYPELKHVILP